VLKFHGNLSTGIKVIGKPGIENGGSVSTRLETRGPKGLKLVFSYFRVWNVYFLSDFDAVFL
jgi:hypothetical protein